MDPDDDDSAANFCLRDRQCDTRRRAGNFKDDVRTSVARPVFEPRRIVEFLGVQRGEAEFRCTRSTRWVELHDGDVAADMLSDRSDQEPDRAPADDDDFVSRSLRRPRRTSCTATATGSISAASRRPVCCGTLTSVDAGTFQNACKATGGVDADEVEVLADVGITCVACGARAVPNQWHYSHLVACRPPVDPAAELLDSPAHLMAEDQRDLHPSVHGPVNDVQVRAAKTDECDVDADLSAAWRQRSSWLELDGAVSDIRGGEHGISLRLGIDSAS